MLEDQAEQPGQGSGQGEASTQSPALLFESESPEATAAGAPVSATAPQEDITSGSEEETGKQAGASEPAEASAVSASASGQAPAVTTTPAAAKVYTTRVTQIDDEPYDFEKSTLLVGMQLMPVDGHEAGREIALTITTHRDIPILKLLRLKDIEPLPPWLQSLLDEMKEQMPVYAEQAEQRKEEEKAIKRAASAKVSSTTAKNLKTSAGKKSSSAAASIPKPGETNAPVFEEQGSLFNVATGQRPQTNAAAAPEGGK